MDCGLHECGNKIFLKDALLIVANCFAKSHFHVDAVIKRASMKSTATICEQLFDLAKREPRRATMIVEVHVRAIAGIGIVHSLLGDRL